MVTGGGGGSLAGVLDGGSDCTGGQNAAAVEAGLWAQALEIKHGAQPARVALTGKTASPGLYEMLAVLGRDRAVSRLRGA